MPHMLQRRTFETHACLNITTLLQSSSSEQVALNRLYFLPSFSITMGSRQVLQTVEEYQKARIEFAQKIADLSTRPQNIESLQNADVMSLLRPLLMDNVPSIQQSAALALGRLANYNEDLAEAVVGNGILPQLVTTAATTTTTIINHLRHHQPPPRHHHLRHHHHYYHHHHHHRHQVFYLSSSSPLPRRTVSTRRRRRSYCARLPSTRHSSRRRWSTAAPSRLSLDVWR
jgi:hypothetical protein